MTAPLARRALAGQAVPRVDGRQKVTGQARYAADADVADAQFAVLVGATVARGTVDAVDTAPARRIPEVVDIVTDFAGVTLPYDPRQVSAFGQAVAVVVATTLESASHGASLVTVRYSAQSQITDMDTGDASASARSYTRGDADRALRSSAVVTDLRYAMERHNHNPMEISATVARWEGDRLTVWDKVQSVSGASGQYASALGVPAGNVRVISPFVGGAFGNAGRVWPHQLIAAHVARRLGRPVKLLLTRRQLYAVTGYRPRSRQRVAIGADRSGRIAAIVHEGSVEVSRHSPYVDNVTGGSSSMYQAPNMRSALRTVALDVNPGNQMRGPGHLSGNFALETAMDDLAHRLGLDPIELRLRNEPTRDQGEDLPFSTRRLAECLRSGAKRFGWSRREAEPRLVREGSQLIGLGVAAASFVTIVSPCAASARVRADGAVEIHCGVSDIGPGTYTAMSQVGADALGVPFHRVRFTLGDSELPEAPGQTGSRTMASAGSSVHHVGTLLRDRFVRMAVTDPGSPLHGLVPGDVNVLDGRMVARTDASRGERYEELLRRRRLADLSAEQQWTPDAASEGFSMHAYGAVFAEVAVDESLGTVRVRRMFASYDAGRIVNPLLARSQAIGGMVMGIGAALLEATHLDHRDGRIVNANMADYLVPVNADVPELDAEYLPGEDMIADPIGVKGIGELVVVGVPAAVANAVFNATGRRVTDLPITLDKLM
ncbi:xanthine dehydrogenase family protein molybdopterin-binding subunit [Mycolicibacterium flavescens]|uniref:Acylaldehyde oxidase n=1 Tax=Mycolicibacterium flavescens TaxID=1776 RepID=A0A1E3RKN0_MYCFV|nr:xanthine dehydrogenase family protein molybdopterin-binding subunit [Mycolicibacterium flavescens]MCV7278927.1 xanthine dehydrogenase family protein molybdopterin-binding subunit [Mycolicibacterium flavescens]ODQ90436.1 acylaldehyde oxidase [Mycolicibacterium flavescens]